MRNLTHDNIQQQEDGNLWIILNRQKTGMTSYIPLLDIPMQILNRYKDSEYSGENGKPCTYEQATPTYCQIG